MDNREKEALRELTEAARGFIDGKPKTLRRLRNATTEAERALGEARAAIEGERQQEHPDQWLLGYSAGKNAVWYEMKCAKCGNGPIVEADVLCEICAPRAERVLEAAPRADKEVPNASPSKV